MVVCGIFGVCIDAGKAVCYYLSIIISGRYLGVIMQNEAFDLNPPYNGDEPFLFVCCDMRDMKKSVFLFEFLQTYDYRVSYNVDIKPDVNGFFPAAQSVQKCSFFICLLSAESCRDSAVLHLVKLAAQRDIPFLTIELEDLTMPDALHLAIADIQAIKLHHVGREPVIQKVHHMLSPLLRLPEDPRAALGNRFFPNGISMEARAGILLDYAQYEKALQSKDDTAAVRYLQRAADAGYAQAQYDLGVCYRDGALVEQDYAKSLALLKKAAAQRHSDALVSLGACYFLGRGAEIDYAFAAEQFFWAAELYDEFGMINYAECLKNGLGVVKNEKLAFEWLLKGAQLRYDNCKLLLSFCYYRGSGTPRDIEKAAYWAAQTAQIGFVEARRLYAKLLEEIEL